MNSFDAVIVGGGIAGTSLAWHLTRAGWRVAIIEKSARPEGSSVRNFGMVWVVGQPTPEIEALATRSKELWVKAAEEMGFWCRIPGSLHLAYDPVEAQVLQEYLDLQTEDKGRRMLGAEEIKRLCPNVRQDGLVAGLYSPTEGAVDPREVVHSALKTLALKGATILVDSPVIKVGEGRVEMADGTILAAKAVIVCAGTALHDLLPQVQQEAGLDECRLQMLRLRPLPGTSSLNIHLCAGLTLGHYRNFASCPSLPQALELHQQKWPGQVKHHIHVLISEHSDGALTMGDSHVYGRSGSVYNQEEVDELILEAMNEFLPRSLYSIEQRWQGAYLTHSTLPYWTKQIDKGVWALSLFGTGMTLSFAATELLAQEITAHHE